MIGKDVSLVAGRIILEFMNADRLHRLRVKNIDLTSCDLNDDLLTNISGWNAVAMSTVRSKSNTVSFICDEPLLLSELERQVWQRLHNSQLFRNEAISPTAKQTATSKRPAVDFIDTLAMPFVEVLNAGSQNRTIQTHLDDSPSLDIIGYGPHAIFVFEATKSVPFRSKHIKDGWHAVFWLPANLQGLTRALALSMTNSCGAAPK